ncbi:MAG TPA: family 20 glycosylhydrolase [Lacunisphaera sp.]|nr:family 20 glycosylhydrolase [Lacunisphaera sp.]
MPIKAFQWDLARQVERLDFLKKLLPRYAKWGYQELYLHLEDAVNYPSLPGVGRADAYAYEDLGELVLAAAKAGIRVVPIVNLLGHTQYLIKHPDLRDLNELRDERGDPLVSGQICPLHPRTLDVAARLVRDMAPYCTAGKVHVGLDESFHLGRCPRCAAEVARIGLARHFAGHVNRLHRLVSGMELQMGMWADMLYFAPEAIPMLPRGLTAYDWYYYPFSRSPKVEFFNFAERDLEPALRKQGISYYGCPMNGAFRYEPMPVFGDRLANIRSWWQRCLAVKAEGMLITSWEAYRLALETTTVVDAAAANLWLQPAQDDATGMLAHGMERVFRSRSSRAQARALLASDAHAFAGYARWEINERWDAQAGEESVKPYLAELAFFERLQAGAYDWPAAFAASVAFRIYLAKRDVFVRQAAREVFQWRRELAKGNRIGVAQAMALAMESVRAFARALKAGRQAARAMWNRTRDRRVRGQNEAILDADAQRLERWKSWLKQGGKDPGLAMQATPLCGSWQLQVTVHNFAPAVQKVVVEQQDPDGSWRVLTSRYTIEFRAYAARRAAKLKRELTVPISEPNQKLRLRVAGTGQVAFSHIIMTDGILRLRPQMRGRLPRTVVGVPAPSLGLPDLAGSNRRNELPLAFSLDRQR